MLLLLLLLLLRWAGCRCVGAHDLGEAEVALLNCRAGLWLTSFVTYFQYMQNQQMSDYVPHNWPKCHIVLSSISVLDD